MPQMAPLNWLTLMMFFLWIFFLFNVMNFYCFFYNSKLKYMQMKNKIILNWKW